MEEEKVSEKVAEGKVKKTTATQKLTDRPENMAEDVTKSVEQYFEEGNEHYYAQRYEQAAECY
jgi:hypothetical protein